MKEKVDRLVSEGGQTAEQNRRDEEVINETRLTLQLAMKALDRSTSTPDQSFSMLLMANAQYTVRRSESVFPGAAEKL